MATRIHPLKEFMKLASRDYGSWSTEEQRRYADLAAVIGNAIEFHLRNSPITNPTGRNRVM